MQNLKVAIAIPSCRDWKVGFGSSMIGLTQNLTQSKLPFDINIMHGASVLARARHLGIEWAKSIGATHILFLDDDMTFPPDIVTRLLMREKDIVAVNYLSKATGQPIACGIDGQLMTSEGKAGIEEAGWIGFGCVLIKLEAINPLPKPLFQTAWLDEKQDFLGEDFYFCMKAQKAGLHIHVDHDASQFCSHIGDARHSFKKTNISMVAG